MGGERYGHVYLQPSEGLPSILVCHDLTPHRPVFNPSPTAFPAAHILTFNNFDWPELL